MCGSLAVQRILDLWLVTDAAPALSPALYCSCLLDQVRCILSKKKRWENSFSSCVTQQKSYQWSRNGKMQLKENYLASKCRRSDSAVSKLHAFPCWKRWESESRWPMYWELPLLFPSTAKGWLITSNPHISAVFLFFLQHDMAEQRWQSGRGHFSVPVKFLYV